VNRRGIALLIAIAALLSLGVIAMTGVTLALREADLGRAAIADAKANGAADAALAEGLRGWSPGMIPLVAGDSVTLPVEPLAGTAQGSLVLYSLGGPILALRGTGQTLGRGGILLARSRVELLVRLDSLGRDSLVYLRAITRGWRPIP